MDRQRLGRIFSVGLALAEAGCRNEPPGAGSPSLPTAATTTTTETANAAASAAVAAPPSASAVANAEPTRSDAETFVASLKKIDMTLPVALGNDAELVGFVVRRDGNVICDPSPCASAWSSLLPSTADHAIVKKAGKLVAVSKATFASILGPVETPAAAATRVRLERSLAVCKHVGRDDVTCTPTTSVAYFDAKGPDGITIATYAPHNPCPYGVAIPAIGPAEVGVHFVRVAPDGTTSAAPHPVVERLSAAQRARNKPICEFPVKRGRGYEGFCDIDSIATQLEYYMRAARQEAAAVVAFERLADELASFGAPTELIARARHAAEDERRHAALFSGEAQTLATELGLPMAPPTLEPCALTPRSLEAVLIENAIEGCANETYAAIVATYQARHTPLVRLRRALAALAADERDHAALAFDVHAWGIAALEPPAARRVEDAKAEATRRLRLTPDAVDAVGREMGEPDPLFAAHAFGYVAARLPA